MAATPSTYLYRILGLRHVVDLLESKQNRYPAPISEIINLPVEVFMKWLFVACSLGSICINVSAQQEFELRGSNYACGNPSKMNLWDISRGSDLIRHEMVQKSYCWKTVPGLRVVLIERVGRFTRVQHVGNSVDFYVYQSDLKIAEPLRQQKPVPEKIVERHSVRFVKVDNASELGVTLIRSQPTVSVTVDAGAGLLVNFTIRKDKLQSGFEVTTNNQRGDAVQVGGKCQSMLLGLGNGDEFTVKVIAIDRVRKVAEFEIAGAWNKCDRARAVSYRLVPSSFRIEGQNFQELVREHTAEELKKKIP